MEQVVFYTIEEYFLETLHINTQILVHDDSSEEALAACEGAVDNVALDGATRWGDKPA